MPGPTSCDKDVPGPMGANYLGTIESDHQRICSQQGCVSRTDSSSNFHSNFQPCSWCTYTGGFQSHIKLPALEILVLNTDLGY